MKMTRVPLLLILLLAGCPPPEPPLSGTNPSARWAYGIAEPLITEFSGDAELREIWGIQVLPSGLLPSNVGAWSFVAYSANQGATFQVDVIADGDSSTSQRFNPAPGPGIVRPAPADWADSTVVFQATSGHRDPAATLAQLVAFNVASYPLAPNQAVWAINFNAGSNNQLVSATGTYIGSQ